MFWKIYLWMLLGSHVLTFGQQFGDGIPFFLSVIDTTTTIFALLGLFGLAYGKKIFNSIFWKLLVPLLILWDLYAAFVVLQLSSLAAVIIFLFVFPSYVGVALYAFRNLPMIKKWDK